MNKSLPIAILITALASGNAVFAQDNPRAAGSANRTAALPASSIAAATQGMKKFEGYFNFYYDEKSGKVLLEVDKFDKEFLYFSSLTDGVGASAERGTASAEVTKFIKVGPKVLLIEPNLRYRAVTDNQDQVKSVESAFAKSVIWGFMPVAVEGDKVLIDLTPFIVRDSQNIGSRIGGGNRFAGTAGRGGIAGSSSGGGGYRVDETRSAVFLPNTKNFPKNSEFEAMITFTNPGAGDRGYGGNSIAPDPSAVTIRMHQSFVELPDNKYKPRKFDPRSGFFQFTYMDFAAPMDQSLTKRFIQRHRLEKKDPNAAVSEAVEPIVYYIDRGAPENIKKALIEGGSWWNQAFEAAGYKNAFQVKELPEGADPMDIRYNVVNWVNRAGNPRAFSYGSSYADPRTGEIIKGVVTLGADRHRQDYLIAEGLLQPYKGKAVSKQMEEMALARIRQLSAHEIGHTLGFTHNFAASPKDRASVMDYPFPRINLKADGTIDLSDAYATGIGSWDKRAVMWGYSEFPQGANEDAELDKIMQETLKQGFAYIPDIGGYTHPASHQWDDGVNPIDQLNKLMKIRRHVLDNFSENAIPDGAPMATIEEVLVPMYLLHRYQIEAVAKSVGGLYFTHAVKNDGQIPTRMVAPAEQWRAFDALMATITPDALALPERLIGKIPPRPSGYPSTMETFSGYTGPTFDPVAAAETAAGETISSLLDPERAARLIEFHGRDAAQPGFLAVADKLIDRTWKAPLPAGYHGELQTMVNNLVLEYLLELAGDKKASAVVKGQAMLKINELKDWMTVKLKTASPEQKANIYYALSQIGDFKSNPDKFQPHPALDMPPGAPIQPGMSFIGKEDY
ncbi:zinc-dependent metalloprotease [Mucilaginibacter sp. RS28]|uniref:Zinc-dependent metalloprotease n=1 Tax=Mucilaginibacter straminoryzae TaxID=2932774 RepID=A0A9X1X0K9_9SPHI|nr:zinc-dependent metalloprotease [Mucilaginibacter straminoryzae]MCJ8208944.1 zinc-dependent metalloprotease [Mucilaginibacter straminoryzae]